MYNSHPRNASSSLRGASSFIHGGGRSRNRNTTYGRRIGIRTMHWTRFLAWLTLQHSWRRSSQYQLTKGWVGPYWPCHYSRASQYVDGPTKLFGSTIRFLCMQMANKIMIGTKTYLMNVSLSVVSTNSLLLPPKYLRLDGRNIYNSRAWSRLRVSRKRVPCTNLCAIALLIDVKRTTLAVGVNNTIIERCIIHLPIDDTTFQ